MSRHVAGPATAADAVRLVEEEFAIAERRFSVLVDRDLNGLDVHPAPALVAGQAPRMIESLQEFRRLLHVGEVGRLLSFHARATSRGGTRRRFSTWTRGGVGRRRGMKRLATTIGSVSPRAARSRTSPLITLRIFMTSPATNVQSSSRLICSCMMASASRILTRNALMILRISLMRLSMAGSLAGRPA
ncbi:hypothetical protein F8237_25445 [Bradyrhizobium betae]|uniref:Uncharacterized protein n=1 Tax=Bradyrhizobium betae TaxID=244734 RepID=A0A5P6PAY4_9BRAD|nr:hypothetical protein F8237_25445 [Bradyrhizobium betae]